MSVEKELEKYAPKFDMAAGYADSVAIIKENFQSMAENMVAIGFYLKNIRDKKLYKEGGYNNFAEFAKEEFGLSEGYASRYVSINERFSVGGNSPFILEDKKTFSKSKLQEMLKLSDEQLEQVTPDMTAREIRALATSQEIEIDLEEESEEQIPGQLNIDFYPEYLPDGYKTQEEIETVEAVEVEKEEIPVEFAQAEVVIDGEYREIETSEENSEVEAEEVERSHDEAWFVEQYVKIMPEEAKGIYEVCSKEQSNTDRAKAIQKHIAPYGCHGRSCSEYSFEFRDFARGMNFQIGEEKMHLKYAEFAEELMKLYETNVAYQQQETTERQQDEEIREKTQTEEKELSLESKEVTPHSVLETAKIRLHNMLQTEKQHGQSEAGRKLVEAQKIIVAALASMVTELENVVPEPEKSEQPELPVMTNNEQRGAFIDSYNEWPLWIETPETKEKYYRYDFENGTSFVVRAYFHRCFDYKSYAKKFEDRYTDGWGAQEYYILEEGKHFKDCLANRSRMIEFLKNMQK